MYEELIEFNVLGDDRGSLISLEQYKNIPFEIKRIYYIFGTRPDVPRGQHAHKNLDQILICVKGSVKVKLDNGAAIKQFHLDKPNIGLKVSGLVWREMSEFSPDCVLLVLASDYYKPEDYIRDYDEFLREVKLENNG